MSDCSNNNTSLPHGVDGKDGKDGEVSTVPGPAGPIGPIGPIGVCPPCTSILYSGFGGTIAYGSGPINSFTILANSLVNDGDFITITQVFTRLDTTKFAMLTTVIGAAPSAYGLTSLSAGNTQMSDKVTITIVKKDDATALIYINDDLNFTRLSIFSPVSPIFISVPMTFTGAIPLVVNGWTNGIMTLQYMTVTLTK